LARLSELWAWALLQSDTLANTVPPIQITRSSDPNPEDRLAGQTQDVIGGLPYTVRFGVYVDGEEHPSPVEKALWALQTDPSCRLEFEICWAILHGGHADRELLQAILGNPNGFDAAAIRGLGLLKSLADQYLGAELAKIDERRQAAGVADAAGELT